MSPGASHPFTPREWAYLSNGPELARVATVGRDGTPHVVPSGWALDPTSGTIVLRGRDLERTKKFRDAAATGRIAVVIDHVDPPWKPTGIEIRGRAEVIGPPDTAIRLHPTRVISWGIESDLIGDRFARDVVEEGAPPATPAEPLHRRMADLTWLDVGLGVRLAPLHADSAGAGTALLRFAPGARAGSHRHPGGEDLYVIHGRLRVGDRALESGDFLHTPPGGVHDAEANVETLVLVSVPTPVEFLDEATR